MKTRKNTATVTMQPLESRTLFHGGGLAGALGGLGFGQLGQGIGHLKIPNPPSATVQADLDQVKADQQKISDDRTSLKDTLSADRTAIQTAITALAPTLDPLKTTLSNDRTTWQSKISDDLAAIRTDRSDQTKLTADVAQLKQDRTDAATALKADSTAIKNAIDNDSGVQAARAKLTSDSQPLTNDQAVLQADLQKLRDDIKSGA